MSPRRFYRLQRSGNLLFLKASVSRQEYEPITVRLLIDTGSSFTTLPMSVLDGLGVDVSQSNKRISIMTGAGMIQAPTIAVPRFNCLGLQVEDFTVLAVDLPFNPLVSGLLGIDFLERCGAIINVRKAEIVLQDEP